MCVCLEKEWRNKKNSSLCCGWKLPVRQSPSHGKNECHCRSCLHKTEILFSHFNISSASWQILFFIFFQKATHLLLEPHSNFATCNLHCCLSSWPVITRYLWFNDIANKQLNQNILRKHNPGSIFFCAYFKSITTDYTSKHQMF